MSVTTQVKGRSTAVEMPQVRLGFWRLALALTAICAIPIALYAPFFNEPFMRDEGFYAAVAQIIKHGGIPYRDAFDNKPPLIFTWYYISFFFFGEHIWAPRLVAALLSSATTLLVYFQARFMYSQRGALVAMAAFALTTGLAMFETNANVEYFMLLPTVASLLCFTLGIKRGGIGWFFLAGILSGITVMTKETVIFAFGLYFLYLFWQGFREERWAALRNRTFILRCVAMAAGFVLALFVVFLPFLLTGTAKDFFDAVFVYTFLYVGAGQGWLFKVKTMFTSPFMLIYATGPLAIFAAFGIWSFWKKKDTSTGALIAAWFVAGDLGIIAAGRFFAHYYVLLFPAMALLVPAGLIYARDNWKSRRLKVFAWSMIGVSLLTPLGISSAIYFHADAGDRHEQKYFQIQRAQWETESQDFSQWILARTQPSDKIYNLGFQNEVYFYTKLQSPTRFLFDYPFQLDHSFEAKALADLKADPPKFVFGSELDLPPQIRGEGYYPYTIYDWMTENYDYVGKIYYAYVWRVKGSTMAHAGVQGPV
ncbi:MAG: glycosyltransferase family 39 protein [Chloroflexota bacterium]